jgi:DNA-binding NarL/FixJ family response regulator
VPISLLITDDHQQIREAWKFLLDSDPRFKVVATCASGEDAVEATERLQPDIVIMDITLPGISGIEATRLIIERTPGTKVLGFSMHNAAFYASKMMAKGAMGYVTKTSSVEEMLTALLSIYNNRPYVCEEIKIEKEFLNI